MMKTWLLLFALAGASFASAKTYSITLGNPSIVGQTQLKPGGYKLRLEGSKVAFVDKADKTVATADVKVENSTRKFPITEVVSKTNGSAQQIEGINLGGTRMTLDFNR